MPHQPFLALITPLGGSIEQPPQQPPGIWGPTDPRPTHPIAGWNPSTGGWPQPPRPPGYPSHPIYWPNPYPDQGLPGNQPYPDQGLPGNQPYPDQGLPGSQPRPDQGLPPFPAHPIVIPPGGVWPEPPEGERVPKVEWKTAWSPQTGWIVVGIPTGPTPTPSSNGSEI